VDKIKDHQMKIIHQQISSGSWFILKSDLYIDEGAARTVRVDSSIRLQDRIASSLARPGKAAVQMISIMSALSEQHQKNAASAWQT